MALPSVLQFYRSVIDDVVLNIRETFLDDGVDEQVLLELKQVWENKLAQSKAVPPENAVPSAAAIAEVTKSERSASHHNSRSSNAAAAASAAAAAAAAATAASAAAAAAAAAAVTTTTTPPVASATTTASQVQATTTGVVHPTLQYHYTTAGHGTAEAPKSVTFTLPQTVGSQKPVTITLPQHVMQTGLVMSSSAAAAAQALPANVAAGLLNQPFQHQTTDGVTYQTLSADQLSKQGYMLNVTQSSSSSTKTTSSQINSAGSGVIQLDGANDTSDDDDDDDEFKDDDNDADDDDQNDDDNEGIGEEEVSDVEPLNSEDDVSDEDPSELFDTDNVIVCQYDKITRSRNKWKFHLKDGIMNLQGRDFIFQKALGDAEW